MLITKEKIVALVALLVGVAVSLQSLNNYRLPDPVDPPAESEEATRYEPEEDLVPRLAAPKVWEGTGRNPFQQRDNYADQAPVPLTLPPPLPVPDFMPRTRVRRGLLADRVVEFVPPAIDPEPKVEQPVDSRGEN